MTDYIDNLPPPQKTYHEFGEVMKSGQNFDKNVYYYNRDSKKKINFGPAVIICIGQEKQEPLHIYDRRGRHKKL